jgi:hypothetical protein
MKRGRLKVKKAHPKPAIADINRDRAHANIRLKCRILLEIAAGVAKLRKIHTSAGMLDVQDLSAIPRSLRQFHLWAGKHVLGTQAVSVSFTRNGPQTVRANEDLRNEVDAALAALTGVLAKPLPAAKVQTLASLRRELDLSVKLQKISEAALVHEKRRTLKLQADLIAAHNDLESAKKYAANEMAKLRAELSSTQSRRVTAKVVQLPKDRN